MPNAQSGFFEWVLFLAKTYAPLLLRGAGVTLLLALSGTLVGFLIGLGVGVVRSIPCRREDGAVKYVLLKIVRGILSIYIEVFRSTPMIVQAMVIYYGIAQLFALTLNQLLAGFLIVSVNTGAYLAEIVRGGIQSVDPGQREAAQAIGMTHTQTMLHVVLPQAIRNVLPAPDRGHGSRGRAAHRAERRDGGRGAQAAGRKISQLGMDVGQDPRVYL